LLYFLYSNPRIRNLCRLRRRGWPRTFVAALSTTPAISNALLLLKCVRESSLLHTTAAVAVHRKMRQEAEALARRSPRATRPCAWRKTKTAPCCRHDPHSDIGVGDVRLWDDNLLCRSLSREPVVMGASRVVAAKAETTGQSNRFRHRSNKGT